MKTHLAIGLAVALGFAAGIMLRAGRANAEVPAWSAGTGPGAGPRAFTECVAATLYDFRGKDLNEGQLPSKTSKVPAGWVPVGGTVVGFNTASTPAMVLCR
ncbi:MAG: hypothetical protein QM765_35560 [Myxococcales bacterium]